jgi:cation diffusion facilitator family transporter
MSGACEHDQDAVMHKQSIQTWENEHVFLGVSHDRNARRTWLVVGLTAIMMVAEIVAGTIFGSMALVADGWHMSTHAAALGISALAYDFARRYARDPRFSYGTGKFGELAAFSSALILALIALLIGYESVVRLLSPVAIRFEEAIVVAVIGLGVNLLSAWLLFDPQHGHGHDHDAGVDRHGHAARPHGAHDHRHHGHHGLQHHRHGTSDSDYHGSHDTNLRAAYLHVLADALTSVLAIVALLGGRVFGWTALDPAMGIVGAIVIALWSLGLLRSAGAALLDVVPDRSLEGAVRTRLEVDGDRVSDLHLWRLGPGHTGVTVSVVASDPKPPAAYKERLAGLPGLSHVTVEVHPCIHEAAPRRDEALS